VKKNQDSNTFQDMAASNDIDGCYDISDLVLKNQCIDWISLKLAMSNKDVKECANIRDTLNRQKCINTINLLTSVKK
jgi:hypothetical protein